MIDWELTKQKLGDVDLTTFRPKVVVRCDNCSKESIFTIRVKSKLINNQLKWLCYKCACNKGTVKKKHSDQMQQQWKDENYKTERTKSSKIQWEDKEYRKKIENASSEYWQNAEKRKEELSKYYTEKYADEEYRIKQRERSIRLWLDKSFKENVAKGISYSAVLTGREPSRLHAIIKGYLDDLSICYAPEASIGPYNFDFLIQINDRKILLEINGDYWHNLSSAIERDKRKASYIENNFPDYELKVIWEHEFYTKGRVENKLRQIIGLPIQAVLKDFDIKTVKITETTTKDARIFLTKYHYSGSLGRGGKIYGAYLNDELIAVITYSPIIRKEVATKQNLQHNEVIELSRLAIKDDRHKKNLASWFISKTIKLIKQEYKMVISFADSTFGHIGVIYKASGFRLDGIVPKSYWYVDKDGWVMHKKTLYDHAQSLRLTEKEFAEKYNYQKVWGKEKFRYIYDLRENI